MILTTLRASLHSPGQPCRETNATDVVCDSLRSLTAFSISGPCHKIRGPAHTFARILSCTRLHRFATENSVFYVPEPTLGLGLAGGLSHVLPRLLGGNRPLAMCLALTGMALEGPDLFFTQLATTYMTHRRMDMLMERLYEVWHPLCSRVPKRDVRHFL